MAKKNTWYCLWGPIKFLNNEVEVKISHFPSSRLDDLKNCDSIYELVFHKSQDNIDFERISHISNLRILEVDKCDFSNEEALLSLPKLSKVVIDRSILSKSQNVFFDRLELDVLEPNRKRLDKLNEEVYKSVFGEGWGRKKTEQERIAQANSSAKLKQAILDLEWEKVFPHGASDALDSALNSLFSGHIEGEKCKVIIEALLGCDDEDIFYLVVRHGLLSRKRNVSDDFYSALPDYADKLEAVLAKCFSCYLKSPFLRSGDAVFSKGKLKEGHFAIIHFLKLAPDPRFASVFEMFLNDRTNFSDQHLTAYKQILDVIHKVKTSRLVRPIIDLINYEEFIPGGDAAFIKKCLRAASRLGNSSHLEHLEQVMSRELRDDVLKEYELSRKRLSKKKA